MPRQFDDRTLLSLVNTLYSTADDDSGWYRFLLELSEALGSQSASLLSHTLKADGTLWASARLDPEAVDAYNEHYYSCDPFAVGLAKLAPEQQLGVHTGEMLAPAAEYQRTEFFAGFSARFKLPRMMTAILQTADDRTAGTVTGITLIRKHSFTQRERRALQALYPHIVRALEVRRRLDMAGGIAQELSEILALLPVAAMLVDDRARLFQANDRARAILRDADGLATRAGLLVGLTSDDTSTLQAACARAASSAVGLAGPGTTLTLRRTTEPTGLRIVVSGLPHGRLGGLRHRRALVLVDEPEDGTPPSILLLQRLYGLTTTEAEIASRIAVGDDLRDIAEARAIALQTVQWFNKEILAKTGCRSRASLVRHLTRSLASLLEGRTTKD